MAVQDDAGVNPSGDDDQTSQAQQVPVSGTQVKEQEPQVTSHQEEKKILSEIVKSSEAVDDQAEQEVMKEISEARLATPEPKIPPDVADIGVKSPNQEAKEVITKGTTIALPIEESEYKRGLHLKIKTAVVDKVVYGTSSLFALATWVGKIIKLAHRHTMKVVFKRGGETSN